MKRLLAVDDLEENLHLLEVLLGSQGYEVLSARNGAEALSMAREVPPDLVISDILMPVMDGFTLCRNWKADERLSRIPFIFYTATYTDPKDERLALDMGADAFLTKPTEPDELLAVIQAAIARAENGQVVSAGGPPVTNETILEQYSEALVRKLEDKMLQLEKANQVLQQEIVERTRAEEALLRQVSFDELIADLLSRIARSAAPEVEEHIMAAMQPIAAFLGVESAIVFQLSDDLTTWGATYNWAAPGVKSVAVWLTDKPMGTLPWIEERVLSGQTVLLDSLQDIPPEVTDFRQLWERQGLTSALLVPLQGRGAVVRGSLALFRISQRAPWEHHDVRRAEQVGKAIANALERKHAEDSLRASDEQLRQSQKMEAIGQLAGGVAHDFNNLLTAMLGYCDLLLDRPELTGTPAYEDVREIKYAAERAGVLTRQILAFSRRQTLQPAVVSLNHLIARMTPLLRHTLGEHIDLTIHPDPESGHVEVDVQQFEQVLMNLALNARDAMKSGGRLIVETGNTELDEDYRRLHPDATSGSFVRLAVSDTGVGMNEAILSRIFEPFFTTKEPGKGTGLGLSTVYGIVKQSGGSIAVYSEPGSGTCFKIYLPRVAAPAQAAGPARARVLPPRGDETILIVEDESAVRNLMARVLGSLGYTAHVAGSADEALDLIADSSQRLDILVTDLVLPGAVQGDVLAQHARVLRPGLPIIHMSGYTGDAIMHAGRLDPGVNFLEKPFRAEDLARMVRRVLDGPTEPPA
ncbi:MAG: response regulator [Thermoleophilia bacterium]|nr:response regulator [Thermoleophilia bacterium]